MAIIDDYPPQHHMLRDLLISAEFKAKDRCIVQAPIVPEVCTDEGAVRVGVVATLVDILGGALAVKAIYPDWIATADLSIYTQARATAGMVAASGRVIRGGHTTVAIDVDIFEVASDKDDSGTRIGSALMTFSRLTRREDTIKLGQDAVNTVTYAIEGSGLSRPFLDEIGIRVADEAAGVVELDMSGYVLNSFGALQGGAVALLADVAGEHVARACTGNSLATSDLAIHYLAQGKVGPFRTRVAVIRTTSDSTLTRVEVLDTGSDNRLLAIAMNTATLDVAVL
jgi:uncharacterized protein (TIGR00369 family)